jgi:hypothetical protein
MRRGEKGKRQSRSSERTKTRLEIGDSARTRTLDPVIEQTRREETHARRPASPGVRILIPFMSPEAFPFIEVPTSPCERSRSGKSQRWRLGAQRKPDAGLAGWYETTVKSSDASSSESRLMKWFAAALEIPSGQRKTREPGAAISMKAALGYDHSDVLKEEETELTRRDVSGLPESALESKAGGPKGQRLKGWATEESHDGHEMGNRRTSTAWSSRGRSRCRRSSFASQVEEEARRPEHC